MPIRHHIYKEEQRVLIKTREGGPYRPPSEGAKGMLGVIAPQLFQDLTGTLLEREADVIEEIIRVYGYDNIPSSPKYASSYVVDHPDPEQPLA